MDTARARAAASALAGTGLLAGLALAGRELPIVMLVCALAAIVAQPRWHPRIDVPAVVVGLIWLLSARLAPLPGATAIPMLTCVVVVCGAARLPAGVARALLAGSLVLAVLVLALVAAFELATIGELRSVAYPGLDGWGGYPEMGLLGVMTIPVTLSLAIGGGPKEARAGAAVATFAAAAGVVLSASRAAWGAAVVAAALVLLAQRRDRWRTAAAAAVVGVLLLVAGVVTTSLRPQGTGGSGPLNVAAGSRVAAWGQAIELWKARPLLGWGPASYRRVYASRHNDQPGDAQFHAHNAYLHVAVETGVLGAASALWLAVVVVAGAGMRGAPPGAMTVAARTGLVCGLIAVAVRFCVDYFDPAGAAMRAMLWLSVLAGLRLALAAPTSGPP